MAGDGRAGRYSVLWRGWQPSRRWSWLRFAWHARWAPLSGVRVWEHGNWRSPRGADATRRAEQGGGPAAHDRTDVRSAMRAWGLRLCCHSRLGDVGRVRRAGGYRYSVLLTTRSADGMGTCAQGTSFTIRAKAAIQSC